MEWLHGSWLPGLRVCVCRPAVWNDGSAARAISWLLSSVQVLSGQPLASALMGWSLSPSPMGQWFRDGHQLTDDRSSYSISSKERTLTLKSASPDDNGIYCCCARNAVGTVCSSDNFTLSIIGKGHSARPGWESRGMSVQYYVNCLVFDVAEHQGGYELRSSAAGEVSSWCDFLCLPRREGKLLFTWALSQLGKGANSTSEWAHFSPSAGRDSDTCDSLSWRAPGPVR